MTRLIGMKISIVRGMHEDLILTLNTHRKKSGMLSAHIGKTELSKLLMFIGESA